MYKPVKIFDERKEVVKSFLKCMQCGLYSVDYFM